MNVYSEQISFETSGNADVIDITRAVEGAVKDTDLQDGIATVFVPGATGAVTTIEYEPGLVEDIKTALERLMPEKINYKHDLRWGDGNGHSHIRASFLGPSLTVPFLDGHLQLGTWQQIIFIDLDNRPRSRSVIVQIMGE
ncbi:MAG: secondary thiamine-phosphate synthase enzyme YjbQ [Halobacteriota archaeon]|nr:secondary thiamine-phosphate synthase enzyme YjbQ [Halobacteriota archaeon]